MESASEEIMRVRFGYEPWHAAPVADGKPDVAGELYTARHARESAT